MVIVAQQIADTAYHPPLPHPEYAPGLGSVVFIDEAHHNFHTKEEGLSHLLICWLETVIGCNPTKTL